MSRLEKSAATAAQIVVDGGVVYTRTSGDPFFFTSGWASPIFIDIKRLISLPAARERLVAMALEVIEETFGRRGFDMVAGSGVFSKTINWVRAQ